MISGTASALFVLDLIVRTDTGICRYRLFFVYVVVLLDVVSVFAFCLLLFVYLFCFKLLLFSYLVSFFCCSSGVSPFCPLGGTR